MAAPQTQKFRRCARPVLFLLLAASIAACARPPVDWNARASPPVLTGDPETDHPPLLEISVFEEEPQPPAKPDGMPTGQFHTWGIYIAKDGTISGSDWWGWGGAGSGSPISIFTPIAPGIFQQIQVLVAQLPDDHGIVPPRNHKVKVTVATPAGPVERMYDVNSLPPPLLEILRLTKVTVKTAVP